MRWVALGDSYTIGTSVPEADRWPNVLVAALAAGTPPIEMDLAANLAVNGYTSADVIERELPQLDALRPDLLSILIGVNDVVRRVPPERYRTNIAAILADLVGRVGPTRVFAVTTPDYTVTPAGSDYGDPVAQALGIREVNRILSEEAVARSIAVIDIHDLSLRAAADRGLVARDGLHPSGAQYALWVERILPEVVRLLAT
jgi:lysophospholipase L1-like esterase